MENYKSSDFPATRNYHDHILTFEDKSGKNLKNSNIEANHNTSHFSSLETPKNLKTTDDQQIDLGYLRLIRLLHFNHYDEKNETYKHPMTNNSNEISKSKKNFLSLEKIPSSKKEVQKKLNSKTRKILHNKKSIFKKEKHVFPDVSSEFCKFY